MHLKFIKRALFGCFSILLLHSTIAYASDPLPDNTPEVSPIPSAPPLPTPPPASPPPTPTIINPVPVPPAVRALEQVVNQALSPTPGVSPIPTAPPLPTPPPMPSIPPTPGPIDIGPGDPLPPPPPPPPPPMETPSPEPHPTLPPIYPPPVPTAAPIRQGVLVGPSATVLLPTAEMAVTPSVNGIFSLVALPQEQIVQVTVHYASTDPATWNAEQAAQLVRIQAVDGGQVGVEPTGDLSFSDSTVQRLIREVLGDQQAASGTVNANGNFTFLFQPGHLPGLYQIRLHRGNEVLGMQFWISDPQNPANDPPAMAPTHADIPSPNPI